MWIQKDVETSLLSCGLKGKIYSDNVIIFFTEHHASMLGKTLPSM